MDDTVFSCGTPFPKGLPVPVSLSLQTVSEAVQE